MPSYSNNERNKRGSNNKRRVKTAKPTKKRRASNIDDEDRKPKALSGNNTTNKKVPPKATKKKKKNGKPRFSDKHPKLMIFIKIMIILFLLMCVIGAGIVAGMFFGLFGDDFEITKEELQIGVSNSVIVDQNGGVVANLSGDEKRKIISIKDMAEYLPKAYVAIEDERFYSHHGVDFKRTAGAIFNTVFKGQSSYA